MMAEAGMDLTVLMLLASQKVNSLMAARARMKLIFLMTFV